MLQPEPCSLTLSTMDTPRTTIIAELVAVQAQDTLRDPQTHAMLRSCSLVSRDLHAIAIPLLFRDVLLYDRERVARLYRLTRPSNYAPHRQIAQALPNPLQYIRSLSVISYQDADEDTTSETSWICEALLLAPLLRDIQARLPAPNMLQEFRLSTLRSVQWAQFSEDFRSVVESIIAWSHPANLSLCGLECLPVDVLLSAMTQSDVLVLEAVSVQTAERKAPGILDAVSMPAPLQELTITASPGITSALARELLSSAVRFSSVKTLDFSEIDFEEVPAATWLMDYMAAGGSELQTLQLAPIWGTYDHAKPSSLEGMSLPLGVFRNLQLLDLEFQTMFTGADGRYTVPAFLEKLFSRVGNSENAKLRSRLRSLSIRLFIHEEEDNDLGIIITEEAQSWKKLGANLSQSLTGLECIDIGVLCHEDCHMQGAKELETELQAYFSNAKPFVANISFRVINGQA